MEKFETFGDVTRRIQKLLEDAREAENYLKNNDSQFARRAYIRSFFAYMEGTVWLLKQLIFQTVFQSKSIGYFLEKEKMSLADFALLSDKSFDLKDNGEACEQQKFLPFLKNLQFAVKIMERFTETPIDLKTDSVTWSHFIQTIKIRNRITHPKIAAEIDITDKEIKHAIEVCTWFNSIVKCCVEAFHIRFLKHQSKKT
jgi:hypothetical protein